jgi:hypothetical protein
MGALHPERCFIVVPRGDGKLELPTDLLGFAPLTYRPDRSDGNLRSAVGPACSQMKRAIGRLFPSDKADEWKSWRTHDSESAAKPRVSMESLTAEWEGKELSAARKAIRELPLDHYSDEAQQARPHLKRVFRFLDEMAAAALDGDVDEKQLRSTFEKPVLFLWPHFFTLLAPPNQAAEWWETRPPKLAELFRRWSNDRET